MGIPQKPPLDRLIWGMNEPRKAEFKPKWPVDIEDVDEPGCLAGSDIKDDVGPAQKPYTTTAQILDNWNTFPPGELIKEEMDARGWDTLHMAKLLHMPVSQLESIIAGDGKISIHTAQMIGAAFGTSADLWCRLEIEYRKKKK